MIYCSCYMYINACVCMYMYRYMKMCVYIANMHLHVWNEMDHMKNHFFVHHRRPLIVPVGLAGSVPLLVVSCSLKSCITICCHLL